MLAFLLWMALGVQAVPDWRSLDVSAYPPDAREQIGAARDAAVKSPTNAEAVGHLGLVLHAWEQFDLAEQAYAEARRLAPESPDWWALSGTLASRVGRHDRAAEYFGKASALAPSTLLTLRHADALLESGQLPAAQKAYEAALPQAGAEPAARYGLGRIAVAVADPDAARAQFQRAVELDPTFGAAHYALAQLQRKAGDLAAARASIEKQQACLACWPMPPDPWVARVASVRSDAAALLQQGVQSASRADDARAIELHENALTRNPGLIQAHVNLITLYARTGNVARAETHYKAVLDAKTQVAEAHRAFGLALLALKDPARAEPILTLAVQGNPLDAESHNALGLIQEGSRRLAEAEASYRRAVDANPRVRGLRFNLARVLVNQGRLDEALAELTPLATPDDAEGARYVFAASAVAVRKGDLPLGRKLGEEALARARKHGIADLAATIERDLQKIR